MSRGPQERLGHGHRFLVDFGGFWEPCWEPRGHLNRVKTMLKNDTNNLQKERQKTSKIDAKTSQKTQKSHLGHLLNASRMGCRKQARKANLWDYRIEGVLGPQNDPHERPEGHPKTFKISFIF